MLPTVPVIVTAYVPGEPEQERTELGETPSVVLDVEREQSKPVAGAIDWVSPTVPVRPLMLFTMMMAVVVESALVLMEAGLAVMLKSTFATVTVTVAV